MNKVLIGLTALIILCCSLANAQSSNDLSSINFSVVMPSDVQILDDNQSSLLKTKIIEFVTNSGVSADDYNQNFIIYPKFSIVNEQKSQGGMRNIIVVNCNISLVIKQNHSNIIFSSYNKNYQTSGYTTYEAVTNAINSLDGSDERVIGFLEKSKQKIIDYYKSNCETILKSAESKRNLKQYEQALAILLTVPQEATSCFMIAQTKAKIIFAELQKNNCNQYLQKAQIELAGKNYDQALTFLSWIDPSSICSIELKKMIKTISLQLDENKRKAWDFMLRVDSENVALKKMQIQAMNNLTIAWLKTRY